MKDRAGGGDSPSDRAAGPRRPGSRASVWVAFAISLFVHALVVLLYPLFAGRLQPDGVRVPVSSSAEEPPGMEVIRLVEVEPEEEDDEEAPEPPVEPEEPAVAAPAPGLPDLDAPPAAEPAEPRGHVAERLRPNLTDERLWGPRTDALGALTPEQREELIIAGRLQDWIDSVRAAEEAEAALTDWTVTDSDGKRWGFADGRIYLGDFSLPAPFEFGVTPGNREEVQQRMYEWEEIMRQGRDMELRDSWQERARAIRERRDRERAAADTTRRGPGGG